MSTLAPIMNPWIFATILLVIAIQWELCRVQTRVKDWHGSLPIFYQNLSKDSTEYQVLRPNDWIPTNCIPILKGLRNAETVTFDPDGNMFAFTDTGVLRIPSSLVSSNSLPTESEITYIYRSSISRPLSGMFHPIDKKLYFLVVSIGLLCWDPSANTVEIVSTEVGGETYSFPDDLDISDDGIIYFSDATTIIPRIVDDNGKLDLLYASQRDMFSMNPTGRLIAYNPWTKESKEMASGLHFANGVALSSDQTSVLVSETFRSKISRISLVDGTVTDFTKQLPGFPDSIWRGRDGTLWVAIARVGKPHESILVKSTLVRSFMTWIPKQLIPRNRHGQFVKVDLHTGEIVHTFHDPKGALIDFVASAVEYGSHLYLGSVQTNYLVKCPRP